VVACLLFVVGAALSCGGESSNGEEDVDCVGLCEKGKSARCPHSEDLRCEENCLGEDVRAIGTDCKPRYVSSLACTAKLDDICTAPTACSDEVTAYLDCVASYCRAHPSVDVCSF
jgi:hypothetical protein